MRISDWSSDVCSSDLAWIQEARSSHDGIILNAGAYSHTSIAILDALTTAELPLIEVHLTNIFRREAFRHHSYVSLVANGVICGLDRKSVGEGKSVSVRVDIGGRRLIKKKQTTK